MRGDCLSLVQVPRTAASGDSVITKPTTTPVGHGKSELYQRLSGYGRPPTLNNARYCIRISLCAYDGTRPISEGNGGGSDAGRPQSGGGANPAPVAAAVCGGRAHRERARGHPRPEPAESVAASKAPLRGWAARPFSGRGLRLLPTRAPRRWRGARPRAAAAVAQG